MSFFDRFRKPVEPQNLRHEAQKYPVVVVPPMREVSERLRNFNLNIVTFDTTAGPDQRYILFNPNDPKNSVLVSLTELKAGKPPQGAQFESRMLMGIRSGDGERVWAQVPQTTLNHLISRFEEKQDYQPWRMQLNQKLHALFYPSEKPDVMRSTPFATKAEVLATQSINIVSDLNGAEYQRQIAPQIKLDERMADRLSAVATIGTKYADGRGGNVDEDAAGSYHLDDGSDFLIWVDGVGGQGPKKAHATNENFTSQFARELVVKTLSKVQRLGLPQTGNLEKLIRSVGNEAPDWAREIGNKSGHNVTEDDYLPLACLGAAKVTRNPEGAFVELTNIGDARAYEYDPSTGELIQLTQDHSLVNSYVKNNLIGARDADNHPYRHIINKSVGRRDWDNDRTYPLRTVEKQILKGKFLLFVTDGQTHDEFTSEKMRLALTQTGIAKNRKEITQRLLSAVSADNAVSLVYEVK